MSGKRAKGFVAAGLAVMARDTGRVLMLQRALEEGDAAAGAWEFPGGGIEKGETPFEAAVREWQEETGNLLPRGKRQSGWRASNGVYEGFVYLIPSERAVDIHGDRADVTNPDDPDGDQIESLAWWNPAHMKQNPALRRELAKDIKQVMAALRECAAEAEVVPHASVTIGGRRHQPRQNVGTWGQYEEVQRRLQPRTRQLYPAGDPRPVALDPRTSFRLRNRIASCQGHPAYYECVISGWISIEELDSVQMVLAMYVALEMGVSLFYGLTDMDRLEELSRRDALHWAVQREPGESAQQHLEAVQRETRFYVDHAWDRVQDLTYELLAFRYPDRSWHEIVDPDESLAHRIQLALDDLIGAPLQPPGIYQWTSGVRYYLQTLHNLAWGNSGPYSAGVAEIVGQYAAAPWLAYHTGQADLNPLRARGLYQAWGDFVLRWWTKFTQTASAFRGKHFVPTTGVRPDADYYVRLRGELAEPRPRVAKLPFLRGLPECTGPAPPWPLLHGGDPFRNKLRAIESIPEGLRVRALLIAWRMAAPVLVPWAEEWEPLARMIEPVLNGIDSGTFPYALRTRVHEAIDTMEAGSRWEEVLDALADLRDLSVARGDSTRTAVSVLERIVRAWVGTVLGLDPDGALSRAVASRSPVSPSPEEYRRLSDQFLNEWWQRVGCLAAIRDVEQAEIADSPDNDPYTGLTWDQLWEAGIPGIDHRSARPIVFTGPYDDEPESAHWNNIDNYVYHHLGPEPDEDEADRAAEMLERAVVRHARDVLRPIGLDIEREPKDGQLVLTPLPDHDWYTVAEDLRQIRFGVPSLAYLVQNYGAESLPQLVADHLLGSVPDWYEIYGAARPDILNYLGR